jgi:hypothetical protein
MRRDKTAINLQKDGIEQYTGAAGPLWYQAVRKKLFSSLPSSGGACFSVFCQLTIIMNCVVVKIGCSIRQSNAGPERKDGIPSQKDDVYVHAMEKETGRKLKSPVSEKDESRIKARVDEVYRPRRKYVPPAYPTVYPRYPNCRIGSTPCCR